jgi:hypothetical protein
MHNLGNERHAHNLSVLSEHELMQTQQRDLQDHRQYPPRYFSHGWPTSYMHNLGNERHAHNLSVLSEHELMQTQQRDLQDQLLRQGHQQADEEEEEEVVVAEEDEDEVVVAEARAANLPCIEERFRQSNLPGTHEPNLLSRAPEVLSSIGSASDDGQIHLNSWVTSMGWGDIAYDENETL